MGLRYSSGQEIKDEHIRSDQVSLVWATQKKGRVQGKD